MLKSMTIRFAIERRTKVLVAIIREIANRISVPAYLNFSIYIYTCFFFDLVILPGNRQLGYGLVATPTDTVVVSGRSNILA